MADKIALEIVTPDRRVLSLDVDEVVLPSANGSMGVLPNHAPLLAEIGIGEVSYRLGGERRFLAVSGGFAEVLRANVRILARTTEAADEIDLDRAQKARSSAESRLKSAKDDAFEHAEVKLQRALCRISVHGRHLG